MANAGCLENCQDSKKTQKKQSINNYASSATGFEACGFMLVGEKELNKGRIKLQDMEI